MGVAIDAGDDRRVPGASTFALLARHGFFTADQVTWSEAPISWTALGEERGRIGVEYAGAAPQRITLHYCVHGPGEQTRDVTESIAVDRTALSLRWRTGVVCLP